jgi:hypothetical protein
MPQGFFYSEKEKTLKHVILILMALALVSCASQNVVPLPEESTPQEVVAPVEISEVAEVAKNEKALKPVETLSEEAKEVISEPTAEEDAKIEEFVAEPQLKPIVKHFVINQQNLYLKADVGQATLLYPSSWNKDVVEEVIAYLANKYPSETKDITYTHENAMLVFSYPTSWGENEYYYALDILGYELSQTEEPKAQLSWQVVYPVRILDKEETETNEIITYEPAIKVATENKAEPATEEPDYIDNWWEDPIFMGTETTEEQAEETGTITVYQEKEEDEGIPAPKYPKDIALEDNITWNESAEPYLSGSKSGVLILIILLALAALVLLSRRKKK